MKYSQLKQSDKDYLNQLKSFLFNDYSPLKEFYRNEDEFNKFVKDETELILTKLKDGIEELRAII